VCIDEHGHEIRSAAENFVHLGQSGQCFLSRLQQLGADLDVLRALDPVEQCLQEIGGVCCSRRELMVAVTAAAGANVQLDFFN